MWENDLFYRMDNFKKWILIFLLPHWWSKGSMVRYNNFYIIWVQSPTTTIFSVRKLKLTDPRVVKKYLTYLHSSMWDNDLFYRIDDIHTYTEYIISERLIESYEEIDTIVYRLMDEVEDQCRTLYTGSIPWSPAYKRSCILLEYWLKHRSYFKKKYNHMRQFIVLQNKLQLKYNKGLVLSDIKIEIVNTHSARKKCKSIAEI